MRRERNGEPPAIMTVKDTMAYLHCSKQHVYDLIARGQLRSHKAGGRRYIDADSLARLFR